jgi:hypothetical protein
VQCVVAVQRDRQLKNVTPSHGTSFLGWRRNLK